MSPGPFSIDHTFSDPIRRGMFAVARPVVERALGLSRLNAMYRHVAAGDDQRRFVDKALDALGVRYALTGDVGAIPVTGPLIVLANHPFGALDGLILASLLMRVRPDVRFLGNHLLERIPDLHDLFFFVDPFGRSQSTTRNGAALRTALRWVRDGGVLAVFPAGEVSHVQTDDRAVIDPEWNAGVGRLILHARAPVLPIYFRGSNSELFRRAGLIHPRLRTILLPRELLKQRDRTIMVRTGEPVPFRRLEPLASDEEVTAYLRVRTYALADSLELSGIRRSSVSTAQQPIALHVPAAILDAEVASLPRSQWLNESGHLAVIISRAGQSPHVVQEIGRLREMTFRAAGEGTGRPRDLDPFDEHYWHLFLWNRETREIVGAYRVGPTDEILARFGVDGLYTSTLFRYERRLLDQIDPALELGRSFVRPEYQRDHSPLMMLWKGIGRFISLHPRYRMLFGPVSISNEYQSISRQILMTFLYATSYRADLAQLVAPRNPPVRRVDWGHGLLSTVVSSLSHVGAFLAEIEADRKGVPVLLRQYLKLNARLLGFNVDPAFGGVLDGLMLVDLTEADRSILVRYMGDAGTRAFLAHHSGSTERRAS